MLLPFVWVMSGMMSLNVVVCMFCGVLVSFSYFLSRVFHYSASCLTMVSDLGSPRGEHQVDLAYWLCLSPTCWRRIGGGEGDT